MEGKVFIRILKADAKRAFRLPFLFAVLAVIADFVFDNYSALINALFINPDMAHDATSVFYFYFNAVAFGGVFTRYLSAMIAALPFSAGYITERQSGMTLYLISRTGRREYCLSKIIISAASGGLALFAGSLIFLFILSTRLQLTIPSDLVENQWIPYYELLKSGGGIPYFAAVLFLMFLTGMLWGTLACAISAFVTDTYVVIASPFLLCFLQIQISRFLRLPNNYRLEMLLYGRGQWGSYHISLLLLGLLILLIITCCTFLFTRKVIRRGQDGLS
ncbi:hypothetical protein [Anaerocolumna sp. MB42-C2]|uniref:hypothetical protein n=1 Tax=Anaerocolumna sp. MB42-C2 TaxID=3070997 RepID=UPI0027E0083B|nr:hypothetical protein [Anaerocolumna sp. MB42-C2]WMJ89762.1 hypothetical protein RBU59_09580 [Anaerocolumna sp. MB42-C2]